MTTDFVHLHVHTDYSLLDGACAVPALAKRAKELKMDAIAMTDHGFMGGAIAFYNAMNDAGVRPIIGCETYVAPESRFEKDSNKPNAKGFHLVLLARDMTGYQNLCKLNSAAYLEGFYYNSRIDKELLAKHHEGLIALSACLKGEIAVAILNGDHKKAKTIVAEHLEIFGRDNFYLEIMDHGIPEQKTVNRELVSLSKEFEVPLVATNDVHYLKKEHAKAHELLLCIQTRTTMSDARRMKLSSDEFHLKSAEEMEVVFRELPESLRNTVEVAERCGVEFTFAPDVNHYPVFELPAGKKSRKDYLRDICLNGIHERYGFDPRDANDHKPREKSILDRVDYELDVIDEANYSSYFLVVWDFIHHARDKAVPVGPGRGSGAGSIVAYLAHITDIDPLRYNLLFERFLNPERVSPPDFDIDFCERRRSEVIDYVRGKYGGDSVAQIGTYGTLKAKAVLKDVARVLGFPPGDADRITKLIPGSPDTLEAAKENNRELIALMESESWVADIFRSAEPLVGLNRNMSIHAAGVIIGDQPLNNLVPLAKGSGNEVITQFSAFPCEDLGLLKMDFLGLRTLTIIQDAVDNVKKSRGVDIDIGKIPLDDQNSFDLLNKGDTIAVFQLESVGMQNLCRQFGVESIEHVIALIAIYRPGPMQFIPDFVSRKNGKTEIDYDHPLMEEILKETYGIMLYQEQIIQVVQKLAGFSLGGADILRRAIGKKKYKEMEKQQVKFIEGCAKTNDIDESLSKEIWEKIAKFANYGFNKSHSAAYAFLAYRTAYLKANYPAEFMAAVLSSELDSADKISFFISECKEMDIEILSPDVNVSDVDFTVDKGAIRFGLGAIKGVGEAATRAVIASRRQNGPFESLLDFCERVGETMNTRMLEQLVKAGAFDTFGLKRSQLVAMIEPAMSMAHERIQDRQSGQASLFDMLDDSEKERTLAVPVPDIPEFDESEMLKDEKALLGFYITGHPLSNHADVIRTFSTTNLRKALELPNDTGVKVGGIVKSIQKRVSRKKGTPYAIAQLEDLDGAMECMVYNSVFEKTKDWLEEEAPVFVEALVSQRDEQDEKKMIAENLIPLDAAREAHSDELHIHLYESTTSAEELESLRKLCADHPGKTKLVLCATCDNNEIGFVQASEKMTVAVTNDLLDHIHALLGEHRYRIKPNPDVPQPRRRFFANNNGG